MHLDIPRLLAITAIFTTSLAAPMWREGTCGPEEDLACYSDGSNGKRSAEADLLVRAPMEPDKTCGPEEDLACYSDGSNGKRDLDARNPRLPTITAVKIPPLGAPTGGVDGGGYYLRRRSAPATDDDDSIVIGSKHKRVPEKPEDPPAEDVGAYDEEKKVKRSLSLDADGHPILTGDNYPTAKRDDGDDDDDGNDSKPTVDKWDYPIIKRARPIDGDYPTPDDSSYPVKMKMKEKRMRKLDVGDYQPPDDVGVYSPDK